MPSENVFNAYRNVINTRTKSKASIMADSEWYAEGLEPITGGAAGKISPAAGFSCTEGLTVQEQGTVSNVMPFTCESLQTQPRETDLYLREARFVNRLSTGTVQMLRKMREYDPDILSPDFARPTGFSNTDRVRYAVVHSKEYRSTLFKLMRDYLQRGIIVRSDANYLKMALLEGMHLYMELSRLKTGSSFISDLTSLDMSLMLQNIEGLIQYFTFKQDTRLDMDRFDIIHELRSLEKLTLQAKTDIIDYL